MIVIGVLHGVCRAEIMDKPRNHGSILPCLHNTVHYHQWAFCKGDYFIGRFTQERIVFLCIPPTHAHKILPYLHMHLSLEPYMKWWAYHLKSNAQRNCISNGGQCG